MSFILTQRREQEFNEDVYEVGDTLDLVDPLPSHYDLQNAMRRSPKDDQFLRNISKVEKHILKRCGLFKTVSACYSYNEHELVFVCKTDTSGHINIGLPYNILVRKFDEYSKEGADISQRFSRKTFTESQLKALTKILQKYSKQLMDSHTNIQMISACPVISQQYGKQTASIVEMACVVIYVDVKGFIPVSEEQLPIVLDGISVDVREGGVHLLSARLADDYHEKLAMGCQISSEHRIGTLGAFIYHPSYGLCCITSAHMFCPPDVKELTDDTNFIDNEKVYQPRKSMMQKIGNVKEIIYRSGNDQAAGVDIALISITNQSRAPTSGTFPIDIKRNTGFDESRPMLYTSGKVYERTFVSDLFTNSAIAVKFGCKTGITTGVFKIEGTSVRRRHVINRGDMAFTIFNQLEVEDIVGHTFAENGDSGALVFAAFGGSFSNLQAVGILEGKTFNGTYIVTPIWDALEVLRLPFQFKDFNNDSTENGDSSTNNAGNENTKPMTIQNNSIQIGDQHVSRKFAEVDDRLSGIEHKLDKIMDKLADK